LRPRKVAAATRCSSSRRRSSPLIQFIRSASAPNSSRFGTATEPPNRPSATWLRKPWNSRTGRMNDQEITKPASSAIATAAMAKTAICRSERPWAAAMLVRRLAIRLSSAATSEPTRVSIFW